MDAIGSGIYRAFIMIWTLDPELIEVVGLSLAVSGAATAAGALVGIPAGALLAFGRFRGRRLLIRGVYTLMGLPPVVAGLVIYLLLSRSGPLGFLGLLYTPWAMFLAQVTLAGPVICGLSVAAVCTRDRYAREAALSLGATERQAALAVVREARPAIVAAVAAGFGRVMAEVGAVMLVGGNIRGHTRVMTTAIVLETRQGEFDVAIALGVILLTLAFLVNSALHALQGGMEG